jgi:Cu+-exporting ATPase
MKATQQTVDLQCYHCGDICHSHKLDIADKSFCCNGCRSVYLLLNAHQLDNYYCLNEKPGATMRKIQPEKFSFLEDKTIASKLLEFSNATQAQVTLHLPQMHCSSCLWLLENLSRIQEGIITSRVNYNTKELTVAYEHAKLDLKTLAQLLTKIGYEPHISLQNLQVEEEKLKVKKSRTAYYKLGITGFCFANIMLISFPEYLGMEALEQQKLTSYFRLINLCLALPVVFYGASEFFRNAWYSFKQKYINIDAPIALAVSITFLRSVYEVITQTGSGYFDSMSGIVFFMLLGRTLQNRTYSTLSFNRDYKSYFPIAVTTLQKGVSRITKIQEIKEQDVLLLHHQEIIPTDCILSTGKAAIDYSFITGESIIERPQIGDLLYAGGKVAGSAIEVIAVKCFKQNSFTKLWNNRAFGEQISDKETSTTIISKYFSTMVILIAIGAFCYWQWENPQNAWNALTAVLIVACPCSLLLTTTFTNGYLLDFFSRKGLFIRNAQVIESLSKVDHIAFDKTGTITEAQHSSIIVDKMQLSKEDKKIALSIMSQSLHPLSRAIVAHYNRNQFLKIQHIKEIPGQGIEAWVNDQHFKIGQYSFVTNQERPITLRTEVLTISLKLILYLKTTLNQAYLV